MSDVSEMLGLHFVTACDGSNLLNCPILSESRAEERREDESKDPEDMSR